MDDQVLIPSASLNDEEMQSAEDVTNQSVDRVCVLANSVERKNAKKNRKKVNSRKERCETETTGEKTEYKAGPMIVCGNPNNSEHKILSGKNFKRKATTEDQSAVNRNFEEKNDNTTRPNRSSARKGKSDQKIEDDLNTTDRNTARNVKENKNSIIKQSTSKPSESEASDDEERNLVLSDKDLDLYVLGSLLLPKEVLKICIQNIKSPSGASLDEIYEQIKTVTQVKLDWVVKHSIDNFLKKAIESRLLLKYTSHRYKI